jgi:galactose mutarotase-like enzyme
MQKKKGAVDLAHDRSLAGKAARQSAVSDPVLLRSDQLEARLSPFGAELVGLRHRSHGELLWNGDPRWWDRQSPILFPVVGKCAGDRIRLGDKTFPMPLHGFASGMMFEVAAAAADRCRFVLSDGPATRIHYPFRFRLEVDYALDGARLRIEARIVNTGGGVLPASFGFHPGFRWPLVGGLPKTAHRLVFNADDHLDVARAKDGLILPGSTRLDLIDGALPLDEALFAPGAMVLHAPSSSGVRLSAEGSPVALSLAWRNLPALGLWMRPGADFLCIEPWAGHGDPAGFAGDFRDKPGIIPIPKGETAAFGLDIAVESIG